MPAADRAPGEAMMTIRPSKAMHLVDFAYASPPTGSKTTSAPLPPVNSLTAATKSSLWRSTTRSAPSLRAYSALSGPRRHR